MSATEFDRTPVQPNQLQPARHFAASYAGEHAAGTEFVIGATFVAWGVGTSDILWGLIFGNLLAVLSWGLICAPIAVKTRLTLYAYLEKITGINTVRLYSIVNGIMFCVLAGAMITVSASAFRELLDLPLQVHWYPTSIGFVAIALIVGVVVAAIATQGFGVVAKFAEVCAPWMVLMFLVGGIALLPTLVAQTPSVESISSWSDFKLIADTHIWRESQGEIGFWHVVAFAWICNLAMHGGLADMTILRFAKKSSYGYFSALGMYIGHFLAWVCAGIMGAGAALILTTTVSALDAGAVAYQALGLAGIIAVIIAGWTTANPTIYRAGLAFQSLKPSWSRKKVTFVTGIVTTIIACFPFVFTKLLDFVGLMGLLLTPIGAVIFTEHYLFPKLGLTRYWVKFSNRHTSVPALATWVLALAFSAVLNVLGVHLFFLLIPVWIFTMVCYTVLARSMGAATAYPEQTQADNAAEETRQQAEQQFLSNSVASQEANHQKHSLSTPLFGLCVLCLITCFGLSIATLNGGLTLDQFKQALIWPTLVYFAAAIANIFLGSRQTG